MILILLNLITSVGLTQTAEAVAKPNPIATFAPFILIFLIFYFLMIKPQKKKIQEEATMMNTLGKGDEVFTKSGLLGTITGMTEKIITLEVAEGVKLKMLRNQIGGLSNKIFEKKESK
jgi:preprotein translocase subunit YajC